MSYDLSNVVDIGDQRLLHGGYSPGDITRLQLEGLTRQLRQLTSAMSRVEEVLEELVPPEAKEAKAKARWIVGIKAFGLEPTDFDLSTKPWMA